MRLLSSIASLLFACAFALSASAADQESPSSVKGATTVDAAQAKALFDKGVLFVDVRKDVEYEEQRIPGALNLDVKTAFSEQNLLAKIAKDEAVVLYCNGPKCLRSSEASLKAVDWGFKNVHYFRDGFPAWKKAGYPVE